MKKLNKIPCKGKVYYDSPCGFNHNYGFIFSEELPYLSRRNKIRDDKLEKQREARKLSTINTTLS